MFDPAAGATLEYRHLKQGKDSEAWLAGAANEMGRLAQGLLPHMQTGTDTMHFISHKDVPAGKVVTYCRIVAFERPHKVESKRVRFTAGGDRIEYAGEVSTPTCDLTKVKLLVDSYDGCAGSSADNNAAKQSGVSCIESTNCANIEQRPVSRSGTTFHPYTCYSSRTAGSRGPTVLCGRSGSYQRKVFCVDWQ